MRDVVRGAMAGLVGTAAMSAAMAAARAAGTMAGEPPPRKVARRAEEAVGVREALSRPAFEASWIAQHVAYGTAAGAAYALARRKVDLGGPVLSGALYGVALWAFGYAGWLPLVGLHPPPSREPRRRVGTEIVTHLVYGVTTALVHEAAGPLSRRDGSGTSPAMRIRR
jgi:hypothetical protein